MSKNMCQFVAKILYFTSYFRLFKYMVSFSRYFTVCISYHPPLVFVYAYCILRYSFKHEISTIFTNRFQSIKGHSTGKVHCVGTSCLPVFVNYILPYLPVLKVHYVVSYSTHEHVHCAYPANLSTSSPKEKHTADSTVCCRRESRRKNREDSFNSG